MVSPGLVTPAVSVNTTNGHWTYTYPAQGEDYYLLGFSYTYYYVGITLADLSPNGGKPAALKPVYATIKLNTCVPDDVECKVGNLHFARFRVGGSLSGSFSASTGGYIFNYGKTLKTPVFVPKGNECSLDSKINDFFSSLTLVADDSSGANSNVNSYLCQLDPGTARMMIK